MRLILAAPALTVLAALLGDCGGGGVPDGTRGTATQAQAQDTGQSLAATVSGAVVKGPVQGAQVCAFVLAATGKGQALGCTTSGADGSYSLSLDHDGPVLIEASGGTYTDEATGTANVPLTTPLTTLGLARRGQPVTVVATPLTAMAVERALRRGALSQDSFAAAAEEVGTAFGLAAGTLLASQVPDVQAGTTDQHGQALRGISRMLQRGATLAGLLGNADLQRLGEAYHLVTAPGCSVLSGDSLPDDGTLPQAVTPIPIRSACVGLGNRLDANGSLAGLVGSQAGAGMTLGGLGQLTGNTAGTGPQSGGTTVTGGTVVISGPGGLSTTGTSGSTGTVSLNGAKAP